MKKKWTRRKFLETGLKGSIILGAGTVGGISGHTLVRRTEDKPATSAFTRRERETLRAAMDEIIPAADGMPAASEVGGIEYLDRLAQKAPAIKKDLLKSLTALEELSRKNFGKGFVSLPRADRVEALNKLEAKPPAELFATLRDFVYEAYYTQPRVWKLIGYEFYPTNHAGPRMKPFDEAVLTNVRKMPKLYREVG